MDILLAFPGLTLVLVFAAVFGSGVVNVIIAVGIAGTPTFARVTAGSVMSAAQEDYVQAAVSLGAHPTWIIFRHILPNISGPILILATLYLAFAIQAAAALSFLGVGVRPPTAEWGAMVNDGRRVFMSGWWVSLFPGLMIMLFVLAANLVGDVLRDKLDATQRTRNVSV
jgi:peptide/nickel transport system permease protein